MRPLSGTRKTWRVLLLVALSLSASLASAAAISRISLAGGIYARPDRVDPRFEVVFGNTAISANTYSEGDASVIYQTEYRPDGTTAIAVYAEAGASGLAGFANGSLFVSTYMEITNTAAVPVLLQGLAIEAWWSTQGYLTPNIFPASVTDLDTEDANISFGSVGSLIRDEWVLCRNNRVDNCLGPNANASTWLPDITYGYNDGGFVAPGATLRYEYSSYANFDVRRASAPGTLGLVGLAFAALWLSSSGGRPRSATNAARRAWSGSARAKAGSAEPMAHLNISASR